VYVHAVVVVNPKGDLVKVIKHLECIAGPLIKAAMTAGFNFLLGYSVLVCLQDVLGS